MRNIGDLMKKAQSVQTQMNILQNKMEMQEFTGEAAGGKVKITMTGKGVPVKVEIDPSLVNPDDVETLEDVLLVALKDVKEKTDTAMNEGMMKIQSSLGLPPGFKMPF